MHDTVSASVSLSQRITNHLKRTIITSKRRGTWFSLEKREKSLVYLAMRLNVRYKSLDLLRAIASVMKKLQEHGESAYAWIQRGTKLAWVFSEFAVSCGNETARQWRNDRSYALYLGRVLSSAKGGMFTS